MILEVGSIVIGVAGVLFGLRCYYELWKWARECQYSRIAIAYKRKVKLQAPLVEWLLWIRKLNEDKDSSGRVIYSLGGTSVAITRTTIPPSKIRLRLRALRRRKVQAPPRVEQGSWSATDQTPKENKQVTA